MHLLAGQHRNTIDCITLSETPALSKYGCAKSRMKGSISQATTCAAKLFVTHESLDLAGHHLRSQAIRHA